MDDQMRAVKLPSGREAAIKPGKGHDLVRAHRAVGGNPEPISVSLALIAELVQLDGKSLVYEDVLAMDLDDVLTLQAELTRGAETENFRRAPEAMQTTTDNVLSPQPTCSSSSSSALPSQK